MWFVVCLRGTYGDTSVEIRKWREVQVAVYNCVEGGRRLIQRQNIR